jgi:RND family efflux transporter MFP subunit
VPQIYSAVGSIEAVHETELGSKLLARVKSVQVRAGQSVTGGQSLVELDDSDLLARLEQAGAARDAAEATLDQAKIDKERIDGLIETGAATKREQATAENTLKAAQAHYKQADKAVKEAQTMLDYAVVRSPMDAVVVDRLVEPGDMVQPGQALVRVYDRLQLTATVRESLAARLQPGEPLTVWLDAMNRSCQGRVSEIVPEADPVSRSFRVKVTGPCEAGVMPGMFGRLQIPFGRRRELPVPVSAILEVGQLEMVLVVEDGFVRRQFVRIGRRSVDSDTGAETVSVISGLDAAGSHELVADAAAFWAKVQP